jgi:hypothetical protein
MIETLQRSPTERRMNRPTSRMIVGREKDIEQQLRCARLDLGQARATRQPAAPRAAMQGD